MPPLRSMPEVINASPGAERTAQLFRFNRGEVAYVKAFDTESDQSFDLFVPHSMDYRLALGGLMMDGLTDDVVRGEYFADSKTYLARHNEPILEIRNILDKYSPQKGSWFKRLINKMTTGE